MGEIEIKKDLKPEPRINVEFRPGRWGKIYHLFDLDNQEIVLHEKDATKLARGILKIAKEQK